MEDLLTTNKALFAIILVALISYIQFLVKRQRLYKLAAKFNGPPSLPIIGDILKCLMPNTDVVEAVQKTTLYYKSPQRLWLGPHLVVHVFDPEDLKIILNSPHALEKQPHVYKILQAITGRGLATVPVDIWKRHRKLLAPSFNKKFLDDFFDTFCYHSRRLVSSLEIKVGKGMFDMEEPLSRFAMNNIMDSLMDCYGAASIDTHTIYNLIKKLLIASTLRITSLWYYSDTLFGLSAIGKKTKETKKTFDMYMDSILENWKTHCMKKLKGTNTTKNAEITKPKKLIEHLLATSEEDYELTAEELRGEVNTIIFGGFESTTTTLGFLMIVLGMHSDVQEKVYEEVAKVLREKNELERDDLKGFEYLDRVIKEVLRIFPPAPYLGRTNDQEIELTNHTIPVNTTIIVGVMAVQKNPEIWPNPHKFDPDRFLPEESAKRHPYSWIPFSGGPRNCIGMQYGIMTIKTVLVHLIMKYKIATCYRSIESVRLAMNLKLQPVDGYTVSLALR